MKIKAGIIKRLHVHQAVLKKNLKNGTDLPVLLIQTSKGSIRARRIRILGPSELISGEDVLSCGARAYVFTKSEIEYEV